MKLGIGRLILFDVVGQPLRQRSVYQILQLKCRETGVVVALSAIYLWTQQSEVNLRVS